MKSKIGAGLRRRSIIQCSFFSPIAIVFIYFSLTDSIILTLVRISLIEDFKEMRARVKKESVS